MSDSARLPWLDPHDPGQPFPPLESAFTQPNGLLAAGGDLHPQRLLLAYSQGIFPWYGADEPILWWSPQPRAVLRVGHLHRSRSLRRAWKRADFGCTTDRAFATVLRACSRSDSDDGVWLGPEMQAAYAELHRLGAAHSVEVWREGSLIGGVYGLLLGRVFFAESMFSHASNGSKLALCALENALAARGAALIDGQVRSPHLMRLGFELWPRENFGQALQTLCRTAPEDDTSWKLPTESAACTAHIPAELAPPARANNCHDHIPGR